MAMAMAPAATLFASAEVSAAPGDPGDPVVIGVTGDFGWNHPSALADHGELVKGLDPDYVVTTGDNVQTSLAPVTGTDMYDFTVGRNFCDFLNGAASGPFCESGGTSPSNRFFPAAGNHDHIEGDGGGPISNFTDYFNLPGLGTTSQNTSGSELYYDVVMGPVHVFVLDSDPMLLETYHGLDATQGQIPGYTTSPTDQQRAWLESALAASSAPWKVIALHHSPYSSAPVEPGAGYGSAPWIQWPFATWGVDAVLSGHHHAYERLVVDGVQYVTNGLGGDDAIRTFADPPVAGSVVRVPNDGDDMVVGRLAATTTTLSFEAHDLQGNVVDRFSIGEGAPVALATAAPQQGTTPLEVTFDGSASNDPGDPAATLTYEWDTDGDGQFDDATGVNPTVTYTTAGTFSARLRVSNGDLSSVSNAITITVEAATGPDNSVAPVVTGSAVVGEVLTGTDGTWNGQGTISYSRQWQRCEPTGSAAYSSAVNDDDPLAYWRLGEPTGNNTAADASGNAQAGTYVGTVGRVAGALSGSTDTAASFNGSASHVVRSGLAGVPTGALSADFWVKTTDVKDSGLISYAATMPDLTVSSDEFFVTNPSSLKVSVIGTRVDTNVAVNDGQWHHVAVTWSGTAGDLKVYVNGQLRFTTTAIRAGYSLTPGGTLVLGQEQDSVGGNMDLAQALVGSLDEVALYPSALSAADVEGHHDAANGTSCTDIAGANGSTYTAKVEDLGDTLRLRVTATDSNGARTVHSNEVGPVALAAADPIGGYENPTSPAAAAVKVRGWAADPNAATTATSVDVYIGGTPGTPGVEKHTLLANQARPDVAEANPGYGPNHGFEATINTAKRGTQQVCVVARNLGGGADASLGCKSVAIVSPNPFGHYERVTSPKAGQVSVRGWALDRSAPTTSLKIQIVVGGTRSTRGAEGYIIDANRRRDDVARSYPGTGSNHGFDGTINTKKRGTQQVCVYALNIGTGQDTMLGCRTVDIVVK